MTLVVVYTHKTITTVEVQSISIIPENIPHGNLYNLSLPLPLALDNKCLYFFTRD